MRIFISAGEASGDLHAAALTREILSLHLMPKCLAWAATRSGLLAERLFLIIKTTASWALLRSSGNYQTCFGSGMLFARLWWNGNRIFCDCRLSRF